LDSSYDGLTVGKNLIESEHEYYRRLLINLSHLYKSKGTRNAIEFFLRFIGAPEPMIKIDEYVYDVVSVPSIDTLEDDIYDVINGTNQEIIITGYDGTDYITGRTSTKLKIKRNDFPIDVNGEPTSVSNSTMFFQKGSGWYDITLEHRSTTILDVENSTLTGNTKVIKTKNKPYTYGEDYFN
jgi:hypothetical protein